MALTAHATGMPTHQHLLHPQQAAAALGGWLLPVMPGVPGATPLLGGGMAMPRNLLGMVAAGGAPGVAAAAENGGVAHSGRHTSTQRQATNRVAQKRYR